MRPAAHGTKPDRTQEGAAHQQYFQQPQPRGLEEICPKGPEIIPNHRALLLRPQPEAHRIQRRQGGPHGHNRNAGQQKQQIQHHQVRQSAHVTHKPGIQRKQSAHKGPLLSLFVCFLIVIPLGGFFKFYFLKAQYKSFPGGSWLGHRPILTREMRYGVKHCRNNGRRDRTFQ